MLTVSWYSSVYCGTLLKAYHEPTLHQSKLPGLNNRKGYGKRQTLFIYSCLPTEYKRTSYPCTIFTPCSMPSSNSTYVIFQDLVHSSLQLLTVSACIEFTALRFLLTVLTRQSRRKRAEEGGEGSEWVCQAQTLCSTSWRKMASSREL